MKEYLATDGEDMIYLLASWNPSVVAEEEESLEEVEQKVAEREAMEVAHQMGEEVGELHLINLVL